MMRTKGIGRRLGLFAAIAVLGGGGAVAQTPGGAAWEALEREYPGVAAVSRGERVSAVFGRPMTTAATAREAMEDWVALYADVFGVEDPQLVEARGTEISNGRVAFALRQVVTVEGGVLAGPRELPVEGGKLRVLVAPDGENYAVTYVGGRLRNAAEVAAPQITGAQAISAAGEDERTQHLEHWLDPELVVVESDLGFGAESFAVWRLVGSESAAAIGTTLFVYVDAVTADVLRVRPGSMHADLVSGVVSGGVTQGIGPPFPQDTTEVDLEGVTVELVGEDSTRTDGSGYYELETTSSAVTVKASLDDVHWLTSTGSLSGTPVPVSMTEAQVQPPATVDFNFNPVDLSSEPGTPETQEDTAPLNVFTNIAKSNAFFAANVSGWNTVLGSLDKLWSYANRSGGLDGCPASFFPTGPRVVFCAKDEGAGFNNTGYSTIVSHEYGHYIAHYLIVELEFFDPEPHSFHEGYADTLSMLVHDTTCLGYNFEISGGCFRSPGSATFTYPVCEADPHDNGQLLGRIWWDIKESTDLATASSIFGRWTMIAGGQAPPEPNCAQGEEFGQPADETTLIEVLTADDDDNNVSNGTPNDLEICCAFEARGINTVFTGSPCSSCGPLPLQGGCRADLNYDEVLDIFDFIEFQGMFIVGDPHCDFNGDGVLDFFDFLAFEQEFSAGCR